MFVLPTVEDIDRAWEGGPPYTHWAGRVFFDPNFPSHLFYEQNFFDAVDPSAKRYALWVQH